MKFDALDERMRIYETAHDHCVLPGLWIVARLDGRGFTRLTKEVHTFEAPFDMRFRDMMLTTTQHLMSDSGIKVVYGYTQSDEISLLFSPDEMSFQRKLRKLLSILAGHASAQLTQLLGDIAVFDCRISQLPTIGHLIDYFRWRNEDAHRNALNAHSYWYLRQSGSSIREATTALMGLSIAQKNELLFQNGINFNDLPLWQKRGCGLYWETYEKIAENPLTGEPVTVLRKRIHRNLELPVKEAYTSFLESLIAQNG